MDVKFVPHECKISSTISRNFYQYTILDECSRKRFLYFVDEHSMYESSIALRKAIDFFDYVPIILQTDNGWEFSETVKEIKKDITLGSILIY